MATSGLLHPVSLAAIAVWLLDEYWLADAYPNVVTDKLSSVAGLVAFPLVIAALVGIGLPARLYPRVVDACLVACGIGFVLMKLWEPAADAAAWVLRHMSPRTSSTIDLDPTDLIALPMLLVSRWCYRSARRPSGEERPAKS